MIPARSDERIQGLRDALKLIGYGDGYDACDWVYDHLRDELESEIAKWEFVRDAAARGDTYYEVRLFFPSWPGAENGCSYTAYVVNGEIIASDHDPDPLQLALRLIRARAVSDVPWHVFQTVDGKVTVTHHGEEATS